MKVSARVLVFGFVLAGCSEAALEPVGAEADTARDMSSPPDIAEAVSTDPGPLDERPPTDHPPLPLETNVSCATGACGPVLPAPEVYTIVWTGDEALGASVQAFMDWMLTSDDYWAQSIAEYGVGKGVGKGVLVIPDAAPSRLDDKAIGALIQAHIADGVFPAPNANTIYSFIVPVATTSTMTGMIGCTSYAGYHSESATVAGGDTYVPYSVSLQCSGTGLAVLGPVLSHETAETATDPHIYTAPAFNNYAVPIGGEIGDLCVTLNVDYTVTLPDGTQGTYVVTRLYSGRIAREGVADPCQPASQTIPYYNVGLEPSDITLAIGKAPVTYRAKIEPFAFGDVGTIHWLIEPSFSADVIVSPSAGSGSAGDTSYLTFTVAPTAKSATYSIVLFVYSDAGEQNMWFGSLTLE